MVLADAEGEREEGAAEAAVAAPAPEAALVAAAEATFGGDALLVRLNASPNPLHTCGGEEREGKRISCF